MSNLRKLVGPFILLLHVYLCFHFNEFVFAIPPDILRGCAKAVVAVLMHP